MAHYRGKRGLKSCQTWKYNPRTVATHLDMQPTACERLLTCAGLLASSRLLCPFCRLTAVPCSVKFANDRQKKLLMLSVTGATAWQL